MEKEPSGLHPENREEAELRQPLIEAADHILLTNVDREQLESLDGEQLVEAIHQGFQQELRDYYNHSGIAEQVKALQTETSDTPLDDRLLDLVAADAGKKPDAESHWAHRAFPKLLKEQLDKGYECTVTSAMLKMALEDSGYEQVHALHMKGHQALVRRLPDGALKIYDPATRYDERGSSTVIEPAEISTYKKQINESHGRAGDAFTVHTNKEHPRAKHLLQRADEGYAAKDFYAYDSSVYVDASVVLENLESIKENAKDPDNAAAQALIKQYPELNRLDWPQIKEKFNVFDSHDYLKK